MNLGKASKSRNNPYINLASIWFFVALLCILGYFIGGGVTSLVIYPQTELTKEWDFINPAEYIYDDSLIDLNNMVRIVPNIEIINVEDYSYENYYVTQAIYNSEDKTSQISSLGSGHITADKDKILNVIFENELNNNDIISMYIKESDENDIYLCNYNISCNSPGYGLVHYGGDESVYNITISSLGDPTDRFNIDPHHVKIDYIYASGLVNNSYNIENTNYPESAIIYTQNFTVEDFYRWDLLTVDESLNNQNINYYYSTDSGENWNLITSFNLSSVKSPTIRLRAELISDGTNTPILNFMTLKYLTSIACEEDWSCTGWTPKECPENEIQTRTCTDSNDCGSEDNKPEITRSCEYIQCTENWATHYSECSIDDAKLKNYIDENSCGTTNNLPEDNGTYIECDYCTPDWQCSSYAACSPDNTQMCNKVIDLNNCYNITNLTSDNYTGDYSEFVIACSHDNSPPTISNILVAPTIGIVGTIVNISLNINDEDNINFAEALISNSDNIIKKLFLYNDSSIYTAIWDTTNTTKGTYIIGINVSDINSNNAYYKQIAAIALDSSAIGSFTDSSVSLIRNQTIVINATAINTIIEITSKDNLDASISAAQYSENLKNTHPTKSELGKYLDIMVDNTINDNITKVKIIMHYNNSEINNTNIDENTLKIYYYNETSGNWQALNSSVNTTANYVWAELSHFSTYGVFGEQKPTSIPQNEGDDEGDESDEGDEGGGGGGGGSNRSSMSNVQTISADEEKVKTKEIVKNLNTAEEKKQTSCSYSLNIDLPKKISFIETDTIKGFIKNDGNCKIDKVDLYLNKDLIDLTFVENPAIDEIDIGETKEIYLKVKKSIIEKIKILGFVVKPVEKVIKSYSGELISEGRTNDAIVIQKKLSLDIEVLSPTEEITLNPFFVLGIIIAVVIIIIFKKRFSK